MSSRNYFIFVSILCFFSFFFVKLLYMNTIPYLHNMFDIIDADLRGIYKGGQKNTQPYNTYKNTLDSIYDYYSDIFTTTHKKKQDHLNSIHKLNEECDCEDYKCKDGDGIEIPDIKRSKKINLQDSMDIDVQDTQLLKKNLKLY